VREVWDDAAIFVAADDHDALHAAIAALIDDPVRCREVAARARDRALAFTPRRMVDAYLAAYARIAPGFAAATTPSRGQTCAS
jgi:glycosyltransferase involved in cell wall biosynthesis